MEGTSQAQDHHSQETRPARSAEELPSPTTRHKADPITARVLPQRMVTATEGTEMCLKRAIRYLASHPRGVLMPTRGAVEEALCIWTQRLGFGCYDAKVVKRRAHPAQWSNHFPLDQDSGKCCVVFWGGSVEQRIKRHAGGTWCD